MAAAQLQDLTRIIEHHWGYRSFRPLQERAMRAVLDRRDSLVVLPTGGGKSLCYQAPAMAQAGTTVVASPLISLMKDQVDSLQACGVPAVQIDSSLSADEKFAREIDVQQGAVKLLFVSPERLVLPDFGNMLRRAGVKTFAIDEAHCISHWGHDFRPEYRQLRRIKEWFPDATVHGYTATATEQVRNDICQQLGLKNPEVLVGSFDRPNLAYRVLPRYDLENQVAEVLDRHKGEAGIIYCIRRKDVNELTETLNSMGYKSLGYHAGLSPDERKRVQEAFKSETCDLIVATVAFGMGIDRSNIRFVLHTGMPKSIEHYQQETGRAGRDGLEAECVLLHSGSDAMTWKFIMEKSASEPGVDASFLPNALKHLNDMDRYSRGAVCRHRALVEYFGQRYEAPSCMACDLCLGDREPVPEATVIAQKILSCVARVKERFGVNHVVSVLRGENGDKLKQQGHDQLSTYGLLKGESKDDVRDWVHQLLGQGLLVQTGSEYPVLGLNDASWEVMKKQRTAKLFQTPRKRKEKETSRSGVEKTSWEGVDRGLFDRLREVRRELAADRGLPPYLVFSDTTLRDLARRRPSTLPAMRAVYGIGDKKLEEWGHEFLKEIRAYCDDMDLSMDTVVDSEPAPPPRRAAVSEPTGMKAVAEDLFRDNAAVEDVMHQTTRARSTVMGWLADFIRREHPASISAWVSDDVYARVAAAAKQVGMERLKPIFEALEGKIPYDEIRLVVSHLT
ncbi:MAG: DNA helicase RecQ [Planctomycetes bacterium]|nr:DNA helicase RecQ [Planctomycetota bacterium]